MKKLFVMLICIFCARVVSQSQETLLIYGKSVNGQYSAIYISSDGSQVANELEPGVCGGTSPNGLFSAFSQGENPTVVDLVYRPTNFTFAQIPWRDNWYPCATSWLDDETLIARDIDTFEVISMFKLENNVLREVPVSFPPTPARPELPGAYDVDYQVIIPSNSFTKFLYYSCSDETTIPTEGACYAGNQGYVIYDVVTQLTVGRLSDAAAYYLIGHQPGLPAYIYSIGYHAWSPDDRYIMYPKASSIYTASPAIYDTVTQSPLDTGLAKWDLDVFRRPQWSPDSRYVAFWVMGKFDYEQSEEVRNAYRTVVVYDTQQQQFIFPYLSLEIARDRDPLVWSPNTPELVAWDVAGNLYRLNVETNDYELIDTQVTGVIAWSFAEPIPSVELSAPTSSPTPTATRTATATQTFTASNTPTRTFTPTATSAPTRLQPTATS